MNGPKNIHKNEELREAMRSGVNKVADIVKVTLGARGRNVSLPLPWGSLITKDGVSVARAVQLEDPLENMWAHKLIEVASKTNDDAGDGTTTATVLAQAIVNEGLKNVTAGANPMDLKKGIDLAVSKICKHLEKQSVKVAQDSEQIKQVATISANGDAEVGEIIGKAFSKVGRDGHIEVKRSKKNDTYLEIVEGMEIESGFVSPFFINDFQKKTVEFDNAYIYICDKKIKQFQHIQGIVEAAFKEGRPIVFIADEIQNEALSFLVANANPQKENRAPFAAIKAPSFGEDRRKVLQDIAVATGGTVISDDLGTGFDKVTLQHLGQAQKISISEKRTNLVQVAGDKEKIENRIESIRSEIKLEEDDMLERKLRNRLSKLNGMAAIFHVGAATDSEYAERQDRIEDSIRATRAASEEGIVAGGGVALVRAANQAKEKGVYGLTHQDERTGISILLKAVQSPLRQIVLNGSGTPDVVIAELLKRDNEIGYDVRNEEYVDMFKAGIIDPKKVTRVALENAASIAGLILTTEGALTVINQKQE